jgi:hypothetical protein
MRIKRTAAVSAGALVALLVLASCKDPSFFQALGEKIVSDPLSISPPLLTVPVNGTVTFSANGGTQPYTFSLLPARVNGIDPQTGAYLAPTIQGTETVRVTDKKGNTADAAVTVAGNTGALAIQPATVTLTVGGGITFVATGGTGSYTYTLQTSGSVPPTPTVNASTGVYTAGNTPGTDVDVVRVSDGVTFADANVTLVSTSSPVNYSISAASLPAAGTGNTVLGGGYSFTIHNGGTGTGGAAVLWWVFLSPTPVPGAGSITLASGSVAAGIAPGADSVVPASWTWPAILPPSAARYLYIMVSAADDLTPGNNTYTSAALTLSPPDVHYTVPGVSSTGGIAAGGPLTGQFTLHNAGTNAGSYPVTWRAYLSADSGQRIDAGAVLVASGATAALAAGATSGAVSFSGTWPAAFGSYSLKVQVSAVDDVSPDPTLPAAAPWGNTGVTAAPENTTYVENGVQTVTAAAGVAGSSMAGCSLTLINTGLANGTQNITWKAYVSANAALDAGDAMVAAGTNAGLTVGSPAGVSLAGATWPVGSAGTRYIIVEITSADDYSTAGNVSVSAGVAVTLPDVKYAATTVTNTGAIVAGGPLSGSFKIDNTGTAAGTQAIYWTAYRSTDSSDAIDGSCVVLDSGTHAGVAALSAPTQTFAGTWPAAAGTYYLKVAITAADDTTAGVGNDSKASAVSVTTTIVNYDASAVASAAPAMAGRALAGNFTLHNGGSAAGTRTVYWSVYVSTDAALNPLVDPAVAAGSTAALAAGGSTVVSFSGTWPSATGSFYLIVQVTAADDPVPANDVAASAAVPVGLADVNYAVSGVASTGALQMGGPLGGQFTISNNGTVAGFQDIHWTAYVSTDAAWDAADTPVAGGTRAPLGASPASATIPFTGTWPQSFGVRYLIIKAEAGDDVPLGAGKTGASGAVTVTRVDYAVSAVNHLTGTAAGAAFTANFTARNNGNANGSQTLYWSAYVSPGNAVLDGGDTLAATGSISGLNAGASQTVGFGGSWPYAIGSDYLVVTVSAADEQAGLLADNVGSTAAPVAVVAPNVDYSVISVSAPGGYTVPTALVTGTFSIRNNGTNNGSQNVNYNVYASRDAVLDASDVMVAAGSTAPLAAGAVSGAIPFNGAWPLAYGAYYLILQVNTFEDVNGGNNTGANGASVQVGIFTEGEPNNDCVSFTDADDVLNTAVTGVHLKPGMSLYITGSMAVGDPDEVIKINTGTVTSITTAWTVANSNRDMGIFYYSPSPATIQYGFSVGGSASTNSLAMSWTPDAPNADRYVDLYNTSNKNMGTWVCVITAN